MTSVMTTSTLAARLTNASEGISSILVIAANPAERETIDRALSCVGYRVASTAQVLEAGEWLEREEAHSIVLDAAAMDGSGGDLLRRWKARDADRSAIALIDVDADPMLAFRAGADDVMRRPIHVTELIHRVALQDRAIRANAELRGAVRRADLMRLHATEASALLAHDLNGGLSIAFSELEYVHVGPALATADHQDALDNARHAISRMVGLVRNFVDIARAEDGALKAMRRVVNVRDVLVAVAAVHRTASSSIDMHAPASIEGAIDPVLVERVLHNLLVNATRYVPSGGRVRLAGRTEGSAAPLLVIEVSNTGPPIPASTAARLFQKYQPGADHGSRTGMGLYFCRLACEAHGGTIALVSRPDFGVTFEIRIPLS